MNITFLIGLLGSITLVIGSAMPDHFTKRPYQSTKN